MTSYDYISLVKQRLQRFSVVSFFGDFKILSFINKARQEAQRYILDIDANRFSKIIIQLPLNLKDEDSLTDHLGRAKILKYCVLPDDVVDVKAVYINYVDPQNSSKVLKSQVRIVTKMEFEKANRNLWTTAKGFAPMGFYERFWQEKDYIGNKPSFSGFENRFYIAGINDYSDVKEIEFWVIYAVPYLDLVYGPEEDMLPPFVFELVILLAVYFLVLEMGNKNVVEAITNEILIQKNRLKSVLDYRTIVKEMELPSKNV